MIQKSGNKTCHLDPCPTNILKRCIDPLLPLVTEIINRSVTTATVPMYFKEASIKPLLKRPGLDGEELKNYRPISNLPFLSKVLERVIEKQLEEHLVHNRLHDKFQSAYRRHHSTETALLHVHNNIVAALDMNKATLLVMLDLSAAFDVIDHKILIDRLRESFGIRHSALDWISSYLRNRSQIVKIGQLSSKKQTLDFSVPQGSVLGPKKYCMFSRPIGNIITCHGLHYHCYADDTQVYVVVNDHDSLNENMDRLSKCLDDISRWMKMNMLKLNEEKSEFIVFTPRHMQIGNGLSLNIGGNMIYPAASVKNLGFHLDKHLSLEAQVTNTVKSCYHQIKNISRIRKYITNDACKTLIQSLVISRLDYGNALLYGLPQTTLRRLQLVQNSAARLITRTKRRDHITPVLKDLHWLPVAQRSKVFTIYL